jgi:tetratricopeptide (TPR) repeat protein
MKWRRTTQADRWAGSLIEAALHSLSQGDRVSALGALAEAARETKDPELLHDIAVVLWRQMGEVRRAEALLRRGADAGSVPAMSALGVLLQQMNNTAEAEQWLRRAVKKGDADAINNLGNLRERQGDLAEAVELWRRAGQAGSVMAMSSLALAFYTHGRHDEAAQWCDRALLETATQENADPAVLGKLEWVSRALASSDRPAEKPFRTGPIAQDGPLWVPGDGNPVAVAASLHNKFLAGRDPHVLDAALRASRDAVAHSEPNSPARAEAWRIRGSLLRSDYERKGESALLDEAVKAGRTAVDAAADDRARGHAQSSLGATLMVKHAHTHDAAALNLAITALREARRLLGADDPEWPGITSTLGGALTQQHASQAPGRRGDTGLIDEAISLLEAAIRATPSTDRELSARRYNLAMAKIQLGAQTESAATLGEAAALLRQARDGLSASHPARAAAVRMLTALGDPSA